MAPGRAGGPWEPRFKAAVEAVVRKVGYLALLLTVGVNWTRAAVPAIAIDATSPSGKVSPLFYGLMTEEINHAYDGGLYAELVQNRAFLDNPQSPAHWSVVQGGGAAATMSLD